jgi:hypothetical protein
MSSDRVELERDEGEHIRTACKHCHKQLSIHPNDINAEPNKIITGIAGVAGVAATVALWNVGFIAGLSLSIPFIIYGVQTKAAETFNSYLLKR